MNLEKLAQDFKDRAAFYVVYITEAHPEDGWKLPSNERDGIKVFEPKTADERFAVARTCVTRLKIGIPTLIDGMDNKMDDTWKAWPDRIYVVDQGGKVAYQGKPGPFGFKPDEARKALEALLAAPPKK